MGKYIYKSPEECQRALKLIKEQMMYQDKDESVNALEAAISYLDILKIQIKMEKQNNINTSKKKIKEKNSYPEFLED